MAPTLDSYAILTAASAYSRQCQLVPAPELASSFRAFGSNHCDYSSSRAYTADVRPSAEVAGLGTDAGIQVIKFGNSLGGVLCSLSSLALCQLLSSALALSSLISASSIIVASSVSIPSCFSGAGSHSCCCYQVPSASAISSASHQFVLLYDEKSIRNDHWEKLFIRPYINSEASRGCLPAFPVS